MIYLDYAATTPMSDEALDVYIKASQKYYGNSKSLHDLGGAADELLTHCRQTLASQLHAEKEGIVFTSGGSEGNWLALYGLALANKEKGRHILVSEGAHGSVKGSLEALSRLGFLIETVNPDATGHVDVRKLASLIKPDTLLFVTTHINSEFGYIEDLQELGVFLEDKGVLFHVDAVQSFGKLPLDVSQAKISSLSFSSHKIYGPKGVGGFYVNPRLPFDPLLPNGSHESGRRQGTVNVPGVASFIEAAIAADDSREAHYQHVYQLKSYMIEQLKEKATRIVVESPLELTSPYILALRIPGREGQLVMLEANRRGMAISTGSACSIHNPQPSSILLSMGRTVDEAREVVRFSFGWTTTKEQIDLAVQVLEALSKETSIS